MLVYGGKNVGIRNLSKSWQRKMCGHVTIEVADANLGRDPLDGRLK